VSIVSFKHLVFGWNSLLSDVGLKLPFDCLFRHIYHLLGRSRHERIHCCKMYNSRDYSTRRARSYLTSIETFPIQSINDHKTTFSFYLRT